VNQTINNKTELVGLIPISSGLSGISPAEQAGMPETSKDRSTEDGNDDMNPTSHACCVTWTPPESRNNVLSLKIPKSSCIYAITLRTGDSRGMLRLGATSNIRQRIRSYKVLDLIPGAQVSWWMVSDEFREAIRPLASDFFSNPSRIRPKHLRDQTIEDCIAREIGKAEYKAELVLLDAYQKRHGRLPPGNARSGSKRAYISEMPVIENGDWRLLDLPCAVLPTQVTVSGDDLARLLW
jgi:hypothetical protein